MRRFQGNTIVLVAGLLLLSSCTSVEFGGTPEDFREDIARLDNTLELNPSNADANRDLGVIRYRISEYASARELLRKSIELNERDAKARFFYGMTLEALNDMNAAMTEYIRYSDYSLLSPYRNLMEGRFRALSRSIIEGQLRDIVASELSLTDRDADPGVVAVFPFRYLGSEKQYTALGYGLAELIVVDLGQVRKIRLVERIRIDELLEELQLSQSSVFDPATTVRMGKLLKAGSIIGGTYGITDEKALRADVAARSIAGNKQVEAIARTEDLDRFFRLQKDLVFDLLARLGVEPTPVEKERIDRIPTQSVTAFILYSIGLERESGRDFLAARTFYRESVNADPNFKLAVDKMNTMDALLLAGSMQDARRNAFLLDADAAIIQNREIVRSRIDAMLSNMGFDPYPGSDNRNSPSDAHRGLAPILPLKGPPNPPTTK